MSHMETPENVHSRRVRLSRRFAYLLTFAAGAAAMYLMERSNSLAEKAWSRAEARNPKPHRSDGEERSDLLPGGGIQLTQARPTGDEPRSSADLLRTRGTTEPAPGRFALLPLATAYPVAFIDVKPGEKVRKGWQVFSHWESPEKLQAVQKEVARAKKLLEIAKTRHQAARQTLERLTKAGGSVSRQEMQDARAAVQLRQSEVEAAEVAVEEVDDRYLAAEFEFNAALRIRQGGGKHCLRRCSQ